MSRNSASPVGGGGGGGGGGDGSGYDVSLHHHGSSISPSHTLHW